VLAHDIDQKTDAKAYGDGENAIHHGRRKLGMPATGKN
jgi:hypothetical protein